MIVYQNTIYGTPDEIDQLKHDATFDDMTMKEVSDEFLALARSFGDCAVELSELAELAQEAKQEPKRFRCRICGRSFFFKGDAKACMRDHRQWRR